MILPARSLSPSSKVQFAAGGPVYEVRYTQTTTHNGAPSIMVVADIRVVGANGKTGLERHDYYLSPDHSCHVIG